MNRRQLVVVWSVGLLLSAVLLHVGFGEPYLQHQRQRDVFREQVELFGAASEQNRRLAEIHHDMARAARSLGLESPAPLEVPKLPVLDPPPPFQANYYVGAVGPILILGACAFLSTLKRRES